MNTPADKEEEQPESAGALPQAKKLQPFTPVKPRVIDSSTQMTPFVEKTAESKKNHKASSQEQPTVEEAKQKPAASQEPKTASKKEKRKSGQGINGAQNELATPPKTVDRPRRQLKPNPAIFSPDNPGANNLPGRRQSQGGDTALKTGTKTVSSQDSVHDSDSIESGSEPGNELVNKNLNLSFVPVESKKQRKNKRKS